MVTQAEEERLIKSLKMRRNRVSKTNCLIPFLLLTSIIVVFWILISRSSDPIMAHHIKLSTVPGYFLQDDPSTEPLGFDYTATNFGLIDRPYSQDGEFDAGKKKTPWQRFEHEVARLNEESHHNTNYKVLFLGRHGEGYHNVAESFYGTKAWDELTALEKCYWSLQPGNSTTTWVDALLTPTGEAQALAAHAFWLSLLTHQKIPSPESYYSSPLHRCCSTALLTFTGLPLPNDRPFKPVIKELFRETIGAHTCDKRSSKSVIRKAFPGFVFEDGFVEEDPLFKSDFRETDAAQDQRTKRVLDEVFEKDQNTWISISSHSGEISSILRVINHRAFPLGTGQVIPVLVKSEVIEGDAPKEKDLPWMKITACEKPVVETGLV